MTNRFEIDPRLKKIADYYGFDSQAEKAIEEMAELIVAIKHLKKLDGNEADYLVYFVEELADVKIMIDQLIYLKRRSTEGAKIFDTATEFKIKRQLKRIADEETV